MTNNKRILPSDFSDDDTFYIWNFDGNYGDYYVSDMVEYIHYPLRRCKTSEPFKDEHFGCVSVTCQIMGIDFKEFWCYKEHQLTEISKEAAEAMILMADLI